MEEDVMRIASRISILAAAALLGGCRSPAAQSDFQPDTGGFDASAEDDAGPGDLCGPDAPDLFNNSYSPYLGGEESVDLEVVDFSYAYCPFCAEFAVMWKEFWEDRPDIRARVRLYYHHFPLQSGGQLGWDAHASLVAVANQGMEPFWQLHDYLYQKLYNEGVGMSPASIRTYADETLHLDMAQYDADVAADETMALVSWDKSQGQAAGITGTPSVFVCGEKISWGNLEEVIDSYLGE
jgi:protein-disulfide isomerase